MNYITSQPDKQSRFMRPLGHSQVKENKHQIQQVVSIPAYLEETYWWAYVRPQAIAFWDHEWVVNLILLGNMAKLRDRALDALGSSIEGRTVQVACVYGDFSVRLAERLAGGASLDIIDVVPDQLENVRRKLSPFAPVRLIQRDATSLTKFDDATYDQVVLFFLLHEMPGGVRENTLSEALRVLKPGGKLVIVDFHKPTAWNPFRYLYPAMFRLLEPFALDIWRESIDQWLPKEFVAAEISQETLFGGLYQRLVIRK
jgi:ubiquinone/menaquinone biosynthesis C-methylase UbiE